MPHTYALAGLLAASLMLPSAAHAQVDCWAPRDAEDAVSTQRFTPIRQTLLTLEDIIRKNAAYQAPPAPVRMRTTIAARRSGADEDLRDAQVKCWSTSDPKDNSPRTQWLRQARETFDFAAVAALLR